MLPYKKIVIVSVALILVLGFYYVLVTSYEPSQVDPLQRRQEVLEKVTTLVYLREVPDEQKQEIYDEFEKQRGAIRSAQEYIDAEGGSSQALLYWPLIHLGNVHRKVGNFETATLAYRYASEIQPGAFVPYANLGDMYYYDTKEYQKAVDEYLRAVEIENPNLETLYSNMYEIYRFHLNNEEQAEQILISGVKKYPSETNILAKLALYYRETGQLDKARSRYNELLIKYPDSAIAKKALEELQQ